MSQKPLREDLPSVQSRNLRYSQEEAVEKDTENFVASLEQGGSNILVRNIIGSSEMQTSQF